MTTLITGWSGLIGRHLVATLDAHGDRELVLASRSRRSDEPRSVAVDLTHPGSLDTVDWSKVSQVVHAAAAIPARGGDYEAVNIAGTRAILDRVSPELESFVLLSSVSVYADDDLAIDARKVEEGYGATKLAQETLVLDALDEEQVCIFRPTSVFGRGMARSVLSVFAERALAGEDLNITRPGYRQNFVWAGDVAEFLRNALLNRVSGTYNLFSDDTLSLEELAARIVAITGSASRVSVEGTPEEDHRVFDNSELKRAFPDVSFRGLDAGLREMIRED